MSEEDGGKVSENHTGAGIALGVAFGVEVPPPAVPLAMLDLQPFVVPGAEAS